MLRVAPLPLLLSVNSESDKAGRRRVLRKNFGGWKGARSPGGFLRAEGRPGKVLGADVQSGHLFEKASLA